MILKTTCWVRSPRESIKKRSKAWGPNWKSDEEYQAGEAEKEPLVRKKGK